MKTRTRILKLHTTPCGLKKQCKQAERDAYDVHCYRSCLDDQRPFCFSEPAARSCIVFQSHHGWRPARDTPSDSLVDQPQPLPGQLELFPTLTNEKKERC